MDEGHDSGGTTVYGGEIDETAACAAEWWSQPRECNR
jgi:hypothetical protein